MKGSLNCCVEFTLVSFVGLIVELQVTLLSPLVDTFVPLVMLPLTLRTGVRHVVTVLLYSSDSAAGPPWSALVKQEMTGVFGACVVRTYDKEEDGYTLLVQHFCSKMPLQHRSTAE